MKLFLLGTAAALTLTACKSEDPKPEPPKVDAEAQLRELKIAQANLLNKKLGLQKQLDRLIVEDQANPDNNAMKRIIAERQQAYLDLQKIRNTHPSLQKLNEELSEWRVREQIARSGKNAPEINTARETITVISTKLLTLSKELPGIREAQDRIDRSEAEIKKIRRSLAAKTTEGKEIVSEIEKIEAKLASPQ